MIDSVGEFEAATRPCPNTAYNVHEGWFRIVSLGEASLEPNREPMITTFDLLICKAVTLYNNRSRVGLVAHIAMTADVEYQLDCMLTRYDQDIAQTAVHVVETQQDWNTDHWPTTKRIVKHLNSAEPRSIKVDRNQQRLNRRHVGLDLRNGRVQGLTTPRKWPAVNDADSVRHSHRFGRW